MSAGSITALVETLVAVGATPEQILAAVRTAEAHKDDALERGREKARNRIKKWRDKQPRNVTERSVTTTKRLTRGEDSSSKKVITGEKEDISLRQRQEAEFWAAYPRKVGKPAALKALAAALKKTDFETIMAGVIRYAAEREGQDAQYTKHPGPWLNGEHWADEPMPPAPKPRTADPPPKKLTIGESFRQLAREEGIIDATGSPNRHLETSDGRRENPVVGYISGFAVARN